MMNSIVMANEFIFLKEDLQTTQRGFEERMKDL